jgi:hypothetical protein
VSRRRAQRGQRRDFAAGAASHAPRALRSGRRPCCGEVAGAGFPPPARPHGHHTAATEYSRRAGESRSVVARRGSAAAPCCLGSSGGSRELSRRAPPRRPAQAPAPEAIRRPPPTGRLSRPEPALRAQRAEGAHKTRVGVTHRVGPDPVSCQPRGSGFQLDYDYSAVLVAGSVQKKRK